VWTFACPNIVYGEEALGYIARISGKKAFIVSDKSCVSRGLVGRVVDQLEAAGLCWQIADHLNSGPFWSTVESVWPLALAFQPDWVIGLGDAECVDAAKSIVSMLAGQDGMPSGELLAQMPGGNSSKVKLMAIPTTGNTGTASQALSTLLARDSGSSAPCAYENCGCRPDVAILDPEMVAEMPPRVVADCAMDALCRAIEGYASTWGSAITDGHGLVAAKQVFTHLPKTYEFGDCCIEAIMELQYASVLAGLCFGDTVAGLGYSTGRSLAMLYNLPIGRATGLILPYTMEYMINGSLYTTVKYSEIARFCGALDKKDLDSALSLVRMVRDLAKAVEQPLSIRDLGIDQNVFRADLSQLIDLSDHEGLAGTVRHVPDRAALKKIFWCAYHGTPVDF